MRFQPILVLGLVLVAFLGLSGQGAQHFYLVTAVPSPNSAAVPSVLWRVENDKLAQIAELNDAAAGSNFVAVDHDRRILVLGSPHQTPTQFVIVDMDTPASVRKLPVTVPSWALNIGRFLDSPRGLLFSVVVSDDTRPNQNKLLGVDFASGTSTDLPWDAYASIRRDGSWEPGDGYTGDFNVNVQENKLIAKEGNVVFDLGIPTKNLAPEPETFTLTISNDSMIVLDRISVRGNRPPRPQGRMQVEIYDRVARTWSTENFPGGASSARAFKQWLAINVGDSKRIITGQAAERNPDERQSAGADKRQKVINPQTSLREQFTVDDLFKESSMTFNGSVELLNIRSGKRYRLDTGQGDTEVLLIDGTTLYYRVNDSLFRAQLGRDNIENTVELLRNDNLQLAHWAFLGPRF